MPTLNHARDNTEVFPDASSNNTTTPLRAGFNRLPRPRLLEEGFRLETVPIYATTKDKSNPIRSFDQRYKNIGRIIPASQCSADRFIPRRKGQNLEAAYHSLVQAEPPKKPCEHVLDLPNDLNCMGFTWQKRSMARALQTIIPGAGCQRILQFSLENKTASSVTTVLGSDDRTRTNLVESGNSEDEYKWPVRPRNNPAIGKPDTILDIPHFRPSFRKNLLDWSSKNMIAAVIDHGDRHGVCVVNGNNGLTTDDTQFLFHDECTAVKFSNSGQELAIGRDSSITSIYSMNPHQIFFEFQCSVASHRHGFSCFPQAYAWSKNDKCLVAACSHGYLTVANVQKKTEFKTVAASTSEIVKVSFSPNYNYVACCGREPAVRVFTWPDFIPFMEIAYSVPLRAMTWHPWEGSVLCTGGGIGDGGLSIWNIQRQMFLSYRGINFNGTVDTLAWNKITGELMVNWYISEEDSGYVAMPVYANFNSITDSIIPPLKNSRTFYTAWSPDGSQIACQAQQSVFVHNFLDKETKERVEREKKTIRNREEKNNNAFGYNIR